MEHADYRIIDANFNRAREALRVIEDYCRFALDSEPLSNRAKDLRHQLCSVISRLDGVSLLACRDTQGDVGIGQQVSATPGRTDLKSALTAACKRLPEALRVLSETLRPAGSDAVKNAGHLTDEIDKIRYAGYTLEKDVVLFADTQARFAGVRLYVVISSNLPADIFTLTEKCIKGGADCIQLRAKDIEAEKYFAIAEEFVKICKNAGILSFINDRVDIAVASSADGVHLGQNDLPLEQARKIQRTPLIFGKSTHNPAELAGAIAELPTYVSLGPVFATPTKPELTPVTLDYVKQSLPVLSNTGVLHAAIGGITEQNIESVLRAGAKTIAVSSAITASSDPTTVCKKLKEKINSVSGSYPL